MPQLIVAHDYICPWCWVARRQAEWLHRDFPQIELIWKGFELLPEGMEYTPAPPDPDAARKPRVPNRFELLLAAEGLTLPVRQGPIARSRLALEGAEFALEAGLAEDYHDAVYHAYWEEDRDIGSRAVLTEIAESVGLDLGAFLMALEYRRYRDQVIEYDEPAHAAGIWNVPTWKFPEEWVAEQPYSVIRELAGRFVTPR